jgi:hypothetical protein
VAETTLCETQPAFWFEQAGEVTKRASVRTETVECLQAENSVEAPKLLREAPANVTLQRYDLRIDPCPPRPLVALARRDPEIDRGHLNSVASRQKNGRLSLAAAQVQNPLAAIRGELLRHQLCK